MNCSELLTVLLENIVNTDTDTFTKVLPTLPILSCTALPISVLEGIANKYYHNIFLESTNTFANTFTDTSLTSIHHILTLKYEFKVISIHHVLTLKYEFKVIGHLIVNRLFANFDADCLVQLCRMQTI